ncbi:hypothetical protein K7432_011187 [Basidiobolus ranarum]|uniref:Uncharacterized protein n=1 Tax=Basidiobolus ranarum TaxID=34480 RepID=A0ABR2VUB8_9FUNG
MAVLVQLNKSTIEPKRLEALKKAISHRKIQIKEDALTGSEDESQEIDIEDNHTTIPTSLSNTPDTQYPSTTSSNEMPLPPKDPPPHTPSASNEVDNMNSSGNADVSMDEKTHETLSKTNSNKATLAELQLEEENIVKKIEKLKEEKHKLFIAFKRIISDENEEGAVQESDSEDDAEITATVITKSPSPIGLEASENKKPQDNTHSREDSFSAPNPTFKRRRSPVNAPPSSYNNAPNGYRKNSRTGANTRGGGAFHFPSRGRGFVSQYPNRGRNGYYNDRDFRMAPGFIRPPLVYGRSLMHIPQRTNTNPVSRFGFNFPHPGMIRHNSR